MAHPTNSTLIGFLAVDKPPGPTSHDVVAQIRRLLKLLTESSLKKDSVRSGLVKVGHTGTLDPFASGLLIITIGSATRLGEYTLGQPKTYKATLRLGATSTTDDLTGEINPTPLKLRGTSQKPNKAVIEAALAGFLGTQQQLPPTYAAIKVAGQKLYEYARRGEMVERQPRPVIIYNIELMSYQYPEVLIRVTCSAGTYIRALARDIGENLGTGAYLTQLRRTAIGEVKVENAIKLEELSHARDSQLVDLIQPAANLVKHLPHVILNHDNVAQFRQGRAVQSNVPPLFDTPIAIFDESKKLVGIGQVPAQQPQLLSPSKVL